MFSSRSRDTLPQAAVALAIIATAVVLLTRIAHAAQAAAPPPTVPFDWNFWTGVLSAVAIAGSYVLHALAARRHSATLEKWATAIDEGRVIVKGVTPAPLAVAKAPGSGGGNAAVLLVLLLGVAVPALTSCTSAERSAAATSAGHVLINCTAQPLGTTPGLDLGTLAAIVNLAAAERLKCTTPAGIDWKCVETDAIGQGVTLGGCALVQLVEGAVGAIASSTARLADGPPVPPPGSVALEDFRGKVGGATWHTATRDY